MFEVVASELRPRHRRGLNLVRSLCTIGDVASFDQKVDGADPVGERVDVGDKSGVHLVRGDSRSGSKTRARQTVMRVGREHEADDGLRRLSVCEDAEGDGAGEARGEQRAGQVEG